MRLRECVVNVFVVLTNMLWDDGGDEEGSS